MGELTYDAGRANGPVDRLLLRGASSGKSPRELSALTGNQVTPERAAQRVRDILASRDWLTQLERKQLLMDDLMALKDVLYDRAVNLASVEHAKPLLSALKMVQDAIEADKIDVQAAMNQIREAHGRLMLTAIQMAMERVALELEKRYPQVDRGELTTLVLEAMPVAVEQVESKVERQE